MKHLFLSLFTNQFLMPDHYKRGSRQRLRKSCLESSSGSGTCLRSISSQNLNDIFDGTFMGLPINDSVYSCVFFFLTGLHFFHLILGLLLLCLLFWSCSFMSSSLWDMADGSITRSMKKSETVSINRV